MAVRSVFNVVTVFFIMNTSLVSIECNYTEYLNPLNSFDEIRRAEGICNNFAMYILHSDFVLFDLCLLKGF